MNQAVHTYDYVAGVRWDECPACGYRAQCGLQCHVGNLVHTCTPPTMFDVTPTFGSDIKAGMTVINPNTSTLHLVAGVLPVRAGEWYVLTFDDGRQVEVHAADRIDVANINQGEAN